MSIIEEFAERLDKDVRDDNVNGSISAAIIKDDEIIWRKSFGTRTVHDGIPADPHTIYRAGSITKSLTAFLMMQLVQDGIIALDDPIEKHLPEIQGLEGYTDLTKITFRQIASHTSGLIREPKLENADAGPIEEWESKVLQSIPKTSFESKPGERFSYSNIGYGILGVALSRAVNQSFIDLIHEKILKPLRMDDSFFTVPEHKLKNLAQGIWGGPFGEEDLNLESPAREHRGRGYKVPNGGIYSTPTDLGKFLIANMSKGGILAKEYLELMQTKQTPELTYNGYGFGFEIYQNKQMTIVGHAGGVPGYSSYFGFEQEQHFGIVIMRNYNWGTTSWDLGQKILLGKLADFERSRGNTKSQVA